MVKNEIVVDSEVGYSQTFLQSTGQFVGNTPQARGKIIALNSYGSKTDLLILAAVEWDLPGVPTTVNVKNLAVIGSRAWRGE